MKYKVFFTTIAAAIVGSVLLAAPTQAASKTTVVVKGGDTLEKIAKKHATTYVRLFDANPSVSNPDVIYPGQKLRIPAKNEKLASRAQPVVVATPVTQPQQQVAPSQQQYAAPQQQTTYYRTPAAQTPQPVKRQAAAAPAPANGSTWDQIAQCESGGNWSINTGNGYKGGLQFSDSTWAAYGSQYASSADQASRAQQIAAAEKVLAAQGYGAWPACSSKLGLR